MSFMFILILANSKQCMLALCAAQIMCWCLYSLVYETPW
jgi:hypothetical protein